MNTKKKRTENVQSFYVILSKVIKSILDKCPVCVCISPTLAFVYCIPFQAYIRKVCCYNVKPHSFFVYKSTFIHLTWRLQEPVFYMKLKRTSNIRPVCALWLCLCLCVICCDAVQNNCPTDNDDDDETTVYYFLLCP